MSGNVQLSCLRWSVLMRLDEASQDYLSLVRLETLGEVI